MFTTDTRTETFLSQMGVRWEYTNSVRFSDLVDGWKRQNAARPVPLREEAVLQYAALMENGSPAPAPILHNRGRRYEILDGVQRLAASELAGDTTFPAYKIICDSNDVIAAIRILANARLQGKAEPSEWTRRRAVEVLVLQRHLSVAEVARMGGWKVGDVERLAHVLGWKETIASIGGPSLPDNIIETIAEHTDQQTVVATPQPIAEFLAVLHDTKLSCKDAEEYIGDFFAPVTAKRSSRHEVYKERLEDVKSTTEIQTRLHGRKRVELTRDVSLRRTLKAAITIVDEAQAEHQDIPYVDEFFRLLNILHKKLKAISGKRTESPRTPADMWSGHHE